MSGLRQWIGGLTYIAIWVCWGACLGTMALRFSPVSMTLHEVPVYTLLLLAVLPVLACCCYGWVYRPSPSATALQQSRLSEKSLVQYEQALLKTDALEAKIKTLETALNKALQQG
jgi:hypothetical protein